MKKLLLSVFVMCAMYESSWSKTERVCVAPAGCPIVMDTGECPTCIDKLISEIKIKIDPSILQRIHSFCVKNLNINII